MVHSTLTHPTGTGKRMYESGFEWPTSALRRSKSGSYHPSCGYLRTFVKRVEFFWMLRLAS